MRTVFEMMDRYAERVAYHKDWKYALSCVIFLIIASLIYNFGMENQDVGIGIGMGLGATFLGLVCGDVMWRCMEYY